jgi:CubicO group peptidase (beta-lactamase class C family)
MTLTTPNLIALVLSFTSLFSTSLFAGATPQEIADWYQQEGFSGHILAKKDGQILMDRQIGKASWSQNISFAPEAPFYIGSVTKQITAAGILKLQEQGLLTVDDKLEKFFPAVKFSDKITLKQMLSHTSGLKNYTDLPEVIAIMTTGNPITTAEILALVDKYPLDFEPGSEWSYSNTGYVLLGLVIEQLSGKTLNEFWQENFFKPLDMKNAAYMPNVRPANEPAGHTWNRDYEPVPQPNGHMSWAHAAGGVYASVYDMMKWSEGLHGGAILSQESYTAMTTPVLSDYGLGLIVQDYKGKRLIGHNGIMPGFTCQILAFPEDDLYVIVLTNLSDANSMAVNSSLDLLLAFSGENIDLKAPIVEQPITADEMNTFVGEYVINSIELDLKIFIDQGKIYLQPVGQGASRMAFVGSETFFLKIESIRIVFTRDAAGRISGFVLTQRGQDFEAVRK